MLLKSWYMDAWFKECPWEVRGRSDCFAILLLHWDVHTWHICVIYIFKFFVIFFLSLWQYFLIRKPCSPCHMSLSTRLYKNWTVFSSGSYCYRIVLRSHGKEAEHTKWQNVLVFFNKTILIYLSVVFKILSSYNKHWCLIRTGSKTEVHRV